MEKPTFWEGLEVLESPEVELLQCGAVADACKAQSQSAHRSPRYADARRVTLTFGEGLELLAFKQIEFLERRALSDAWQGNAGQ